MEMTMRKTILTVLAISLMVTMTVPSAGASERHHARMKGCAAASERYRDANAYAAPWYRSERPYLSNLDEGAMTSGPAGH